jgi:choice-of-anchor C domain-containing protein
VKRRSMFSAAFAVVASLAVAGSALAASGFTNGGFEDGTLVPMYGSDFHRVYAGDTDVAPWMVTGNVDWVGSGYWQAAEGTKSIDLDGDEATRGAISQTVATTVNSTYVVTFKMSGNPDSGPSLKTFTVNATGGGAPQAYSYDTAARGTTRANMQWVDASAYTFVATGSSSTLTFTSTTDGGYGAVVDSIKVTETVATGAQCKKGGWATMHDSVGNSFKNQGDCVSFYATDGRNLGAISN